MMMKQTDIDHGREFDWGLTSADYAKYREHYPPEFFQKLVDTGLCINGQVVLDLGTGTGVLPRSLYPYGGRFIGIDVAENQISTARRLAQESNYDIQFIVSAAEKVDFPDNTFDVVTACQSFTYFDKQVLLPALYRMLKPGGRLAILSMVWLPGESDIACQTEVLVLKYNPAWTGAGFERKNYDPAQWAQGLFTAEYNFGFDLSIPFTRESWNGRIRACRGIGASLTPDQINAFDHEHRLLLEKIAPESFTILHYATILILQSTKSIIIAE
jgi:SAM-dependent methyltransferase